MIEEERKELYLKMMNICVFINLAATPKRPDGTYNYSREALEQKAKELLK
jgi:hypothetical protein